MFLRVPRACWRQLLQFSALCIMFCKMCVTVALCLTFLLALSEGFFMPLSLRKQAPQTTYSNPHWVPSSGIVGNPNGANTIPAGYGNPKDLSNYQQQQQQQQQQPQQTPLQQQGAYSSQLYTVQATAPKYEPLPFQSTNQPQYAYEGVYSPALNPYPQSVQLVPCLCPVNKEVIEQQQNQQLQQQSSAPVVPTSSSYPGDSNANASPPQSNPKKTS